MELTLPKGYKENNKNILKDVRQRMKLDSEFHYLFQGPVGCGKTVLSRIIETHLTRYSRKRIKSKSLICRRIYEKYLKIIASNFTDKYDAIDDMYRDLQSEFLILDDLGDERPGTDSAHDFIGGLIEERYDYLKRTDFKGHTIVSTNLDSGEIINFYGSRVYDRMQEMFVICKFNKVSFREEKLTIIKG